MSDHHGQELTVAAGTPITRPIPAAPTAEPVTQPASRGPAGADSL